MLVCFWWLYWNKVWYDIWCKLLLTHSVSCFKNLYSQNPVSQVLHTKMMLIRIYDQVQVQRSRKPCYLFAYFAGHIWLDWILCWYCCCYRCHFIWKVRSYYTHLKPLIKWLVIRYTSSDENTWFACLWTDIGIFVDFLDNLVKSWNPRGLFLKFEKKKKKKKKNHL